jgi:hypothetical protein
LKNRLLGDHQKDEEHRKDSVISVNAKNIIVIRAEHLLSITLTKTSIDLAQRLSEMFNNACTKQVTVREDDDDAILSVYNWTGYEILIDEIIGVEVSLFVITLKMIAFLKFAENNKYENSVNLKHEESVPLAISDERLTATHLPAIAEQVAKRRQEFSVTVKEHYSKSSLFKYLNY